MKSTVQLLVTADNHLDPSALSFGPRRSERRGDHLRCFEEVMEYALSNRPDFLLLGGDVFDSLRPSNYVRARVMEWFRKLSVAGVVILAVSGHHDTPKSLDDAVSPLMEYGSSGHIHYFQNLEKPEHITYSVDNLDVTVYGISCNPIQDTVLSLDYTPSSSRLKILLMHQAIEGFAPIHDQPHVKLSTIPSDISLVAAGHLHRHQVKKHGGTTIVYPGSTERASFAEEDEVKGFVWAEIMGDGEVMVEHVPTSARPFKTVELVIGEGDITEQVSNTLKKFSDKNLICRLMLKGVVAPEKMLDYRRSDIVLENRDRFFHLVVDDSGLEFRRSERVGGLQYTTPLEELRNYFHKLRVDGGFEGDVLDEAYRLTVSMLEAEGLW